MRTSARDFVEMLGSLDRSIDAFFGLDHVCMSKQLDLVSDFFWGNPPSLDLKVCESSRLWKINQSGRSGDADEGRRERRTTTRRWDERMSIPWMECVYKTA